MVSRRLNVNVLTGEKLARAFRRNHGRLAGAGFSLWVDNSLAAMVRDYESTVNAPLGMVVGKLRH